MRDVNGISLKPKLTKNYILDNISQEQIFSYYLGIPIHTIYDCIESNNLIPSVFRGDDNNSSMGFTYNSKHKIVCRDFGGYFWGDCVDAAAFILRKNANIGRDFMEILEDIAKTFNLISGSNSPVNRQETAKILKVKKKLKIQVSTRPWNRFDTEFWYNKYGVSPNVLDVHMTYILSHVWVNDFLVYSYKGDKDVAYGYFTGTSMCEVTGDEIQGWKIDHPHRKVDEGKFIQNNSNLFGGHLMMPTTKLGLHIKSAKDVICVNQFRLLDSELLLQGIAPPSESKILDQNQFTYISNIWKEAVQYSFSDFDLAGVTYAQDMKRKYAINRIFLTNGRYNTPNIGAKDFSDLLFSRGVDKGRDFLYLFYNNREDTKNMQKLLSNFLNP